MKTINERYVFNGEGQKTDVILTVDDYERLLEDIHDLAVLAERREETSISMKEMKKRLNYYE